MTRRNLHRQTFWSSAAGAFILLLSLWLVSPAEAEPPAQETEKYCLSCHGNADLSITLPNRDELSLYIPQDALDHSVHSAKGIECEACHNDITEYPHPELKYQSARELSRAYYQTCEKCHSLNYEKAQDSMHAKAAEAGNLEAPICTDCHGAHDVRSPAGQHDSSIRGLTPQVARFRLNFHVPPFLGKLWDSANLVQAHGSENDNHLGNVPELKGGTFNECFGRRA